MDYIEELKAYMARNNLDKADMARLFGVTWQTFHHWMSRESLPKHQYGRAVEILAEDGVIPAVVLAMSEKISSLSPEVAKAVLRSIDIFCDLDRKR